MSLPSPLIVPPRRSWASRFLQRLRDRSPASRAAPPLNGASSGLAHPHEPAGSLEKVSHDLIANDRYAFLLLKDAAVEDADAAPAWKAVEAHMALVPGGVVPILLGHGGVEQADVFSFFLDRCAVTNQEFHRFVRAGGYDALEIWPQEVWPGLMRFSDQTGRPGPRDWEHGRYPPGKADHPVVGVCWFEALAYARWVGKRLPTAAEWQKAGGWPEQLSGGACNRYPWGDVFDPARVNLWASGFGQTLPVQSCPRGDTPNGIHQMTGNVWEWLDDPLESIPCRAGEIFDSPRPIRRIVGGAFNTYLATEATCQFVTGQPELDRRANIGFRCALTVGSLRPMPGA